MKFTNGGRTPAKDNKSDAFTSAPWGMDLYVDQKTTTKEATYVPFVLDGTVGYEVRWQSGKVSYLILNPSSEVDDGVPPDVFVYEGPTPRVNDGQPLCYLALKEPK